MISTQNLQRIALSFGFFLSTTSILLTGQASAQSLETTDSISIGASATFNNSWAQTFEATGTLDTNQASGNVTIFEALDPSTAIVVPNSGLAELSATVSALEQDGGELTASASIDSGTGSENNLVLNGGTNGAASILITPDNTTVTTIGASIIGTNIGTDEMQVTGVRTRTAINDLSVFH